MDKRAQLILTRARNLLLRDHPDERWPAVTDKPDASVLERQGKYLSLAEDQLLREGVIESVDQS